MPIKRQPGRPSPEKFEESAIRFLYHRHVWLDKSTGLYQDHEDNDSQVIMNEYYADGLMPYDDFDMEKFVLAQLAHYKSTERSRTIILSSQ